LALLTPADVHFGRAEAVLGERQRVLAAAYALHPERFVKGAPQAGEVPTAVWINPPALSAALPSEPGSPPCLSSTGNGSSMLP